MAGPRENSRTTSEATGSYELSAFCPRFEGNARKIPTNRGVQDVVRELSRESSHVSDWIVGRAILSKIITRMELLFSNYLGDYSYSFQGSSELISITVTVSLSFLQNADTGNISPQEFSRVSGNCSYMINGFRIKNVMIRKEWYR